MDRPHEAKDVVLRVFVKALAKRVGTPPQTPPVSCWVKNRPRHPTIWGLGVGNMVRPPRPLIRRRKTIHEYSGN